MRNLRTILLLALSISSGFSFSQIKPSQIGYPYTQIPFTAVKVTDNSFWGARLKAVREVTIPLALNKCRTEGRIDNFVKASHPDEAYDVNAFMGFPFDDTDVYKTIEGASYILQTYPNEQLEQSIDSMIDLMAKAQEPDGYLYTARTINPKKPHRWSGTKRWEKEEVLSHELYNLGHLVDAACAHFEATNSTKMLEIAQKFADCVIKEVGPGDHQATVVPGHQIAEMALARLYLLTGEKKYLDEAKFLLDFRGKTSIHDTYTQSDKPISEQQEAWGHAVRAGYMYAGIADVAAFTGDSAYIRTIDRIWNNIVDKKYYLTGGVGARHEGEAFGSDYELPNLTAYNETCAAIAQVYLNQRMFLLHGDSKYIDCLERTLYNGVISGMSVDGGRFFYPNPLSSDGKYKFNADGTNTRQPWFGCACCPSNLCRFIPSVPGYIYAVKDREIYINLFASNTANFSVDNKKIQLEQRTEYPWNGDITIKVNENKLGQFKLNIRIPGWLRNEPVPGSLYHYTDGLQPQFTISVNGVELKQGEIIKGYASIERVWKKNDLISIHFDMLPRMVKANNRVEADKGKVAIERGPLVYCAEEADNAGLDIPHVFLNKQPDFSIVPGMQIQNKEADGTIFQVTGIQAMAQSPYLDSLGKIHLKDDKITLIPYYSWNHRGAGIMDVWLYQGLEF